MRSALPQARLFAFTGTPIETHDRSTRRWFSPEIDGERENYLDSYRIKEAIDDGATVPIRYEACMPQWAVRLEDLDDTFEHEFVGLTDEQKAELRARAVRPNVVAKTPDRVKATVMKAVAVACR
jgi:type I restriction enzyme R subunit